MYLCIFPNLSQKRDPLFCEYVSCVSYVSCTICIICNKRICVFPHLSQKCDQLFRECHEFVYALTCLHVHLSPKESTHVPSALLLIAISFLIDLALHIEAAERESWRVSPMYRTVFVGGVCFVSTVRLLPQEMSIGGECDKNGKSPIVCLYFPRFVPKM